MVVKSTGGDLAATLDLGHLCTFLGLRVDELVMQRLAADGHRRLRHSHGFIIQHVIESPRTITELARRMEVSQQAASKAVAELARLGILETAAGADRRAKAIRLSARGWRVVQSARRARAAVDARVKRAIGASRYGAARSAVLDGLTALGGLDRVLARRVRPPR